VLAVRVRRILKHHCTMAEFDRGLPFVGCKCSRYILQHEAEQLILAGDAAWKLRLNVSGETIADHEEIVLVKFHPQRARLITDRDIEHAYADLNLAEQKRILMFGANGGVVTKLVRSQEVKKS
jgi:hypothetical protein